MYSIPSYYDQFGSCSNSINNILQEALISSKETTRSGNSILSSKSAAEEKAIAASKSHSEAERRRRKRINGHLATLRSLVPKTIKSDKASLLAEVVRRIKELKKTTTELATSDSDIDNNNNVGCHDINTVSTESIFPSESDEVRLCYSDRQSGTVKATVSCEDRAELMPEMTRAVRAAEGKVVRAEMATVGGRTKTVLWVRVDSAGDDDDDDGLGRLRRALKVIVDRRDRVGLSSTESGSGQALLGNKRPRLSLYSDF